MFMAKIYLRYFNPIMSIKLNNSLIYSIYNTSYYLVFLANRSRAENYY